MKDARREHAILERLGVAEVFAQERVDEEAAALRLEQPTLVA
jgi:hypothetical protein